MKYKVGDRFVSNYQYKNIIEIIKIDKNNSPHVYISQENPISSWSENHLDKYYQLEKCYIWNKELKEIIG